MKYIIWEFVLFQRNVFIVMLIVGDVDVYVGLLIYFYDIYFFVCLMVVFFKIMNYNIFIFVFFGIRKNR